MARFDPRTNAERQADAQRARMTKADKLAMYRGMLARAERAGLQRLDIQEIIAKLEGRLI
jgi:hypothetical protein